MSKTRALATLDSNSGSGYELQRQNKTVHAVHACINGKSTISQGAIMDDDALQDQRFLISSIETLLATLEDSDDEEGQAVTITDLIEAYNILYLRLRSVVSELSAVKNAGSSFPAFAPIQTHASKLVFCMRRDIRSARHFASRTHGDVSLTLDDCPVLTPSDLENSRLVSLLSQHALRFLSLVFALPSVNSMFQVKDLGSLTRMLTQMIASELPVLEGDKVHALVFSVLQTQVLPEGIVTSKSCDIAGGINRTIKLDSASGGASIIALKSVNGLLMRHPEMLSDFTSLLRHILDRLTADNPEESSQAAFALSGFVFAKLALLATPIRNATFRVRNETSKTLRTIADTVHEYIKAQAHSRPVDLDHKNLPDLISDAFITHPSKSSRSAEWCLSTLAMLALLTGPSIFMNATSLRLMLISLQPAAKHPMHGSVWKALVWILSRASVGDHDSESMVTNTVPDGKVLSVDCYRRAFRVLQQELKPGVGTCLIATVLSRSYDSGSKDLKAASKAKGKLEGNHKFKAENAVAAVTVLQSLIPSFAPPTPSIRKQAEQRQRIEEGVSLLSRLVCGASSDYGAKSWKAKDFFPSSLIDGSLLQAKYTIKRPDDESNRDAFAQSAILHDIPPLSEKDIVNNWECLAECWRAACIWATYRGSNEVLSDMDTLAGIWQALLLSQSHLMQGRSNLTAGGEDKGAKFGHCLERIIRDTLFEPHGSQKVIDEHQRQRNALNLVKKLWKVFPNTYPPSHLTFPGEIIFTSLLDATSVATTSDNNTGIVALSVDTVREAWVDVCQELFARGGVTVKWTMGILQERLSRASQGSALQAVRTLWYILGQQVVRDSKVRLDYVWQDLISFLVHPFARGMWQLDEEEQKLWVVVLERTVVLADGDERRMVEEDAVIDSLLDSLPSQTNQDALISADHCISFLLSRISLLVPPYMNACTAFPPRVHRLLDWQNDVLLKLYDIGSADAGYGGLPDLDVMGDPWTRESGLSDGHVEPADLVTDVLLRLLPSLSTWLNDPSELLDDEQHRHLHATIYIPGLSYIAKLPPSLATLQNFERFLLSPLSRERATKAEIDAFRAFWRESYHKREVVSGGVVDDESTHYIDPKDLPHSLRECLGGLGEAIGDSIGFGMSSPTAASPSIVPDSQIQASSPLDQCMRQFSDSDYPVNSGWSQFSDLMRQVGHGYQVTAKTPAPQEGEEKVAPPSSGSSWWSPPGLLSDPDASPIKDALRELRDYASSSNISAVSSSPPRPTSRDDILKGVRKRLFDDADEDQHGGIDLEVHEDERPRKRQRSLMPLSKHAQPRIEHRMQTRGRSSVPPSTRALSKLPASSDVEEDGAEHEDDIDNDYHSWEAELNIGGLRALQREAPNDTN